MINRPLFALCVCLGLASCNEVEPISTSAPSTRNIVGPGPNPVEITNATVMFSDICVDTAPTFAGAESRLAAGSYQEAPTGTYFHRNLNLSFKVRETGAFRVCSMVVAGDDFDRSSEIILASAGKGKVTVDVRNGGRSSQGFTYLAAAVRTPK